jgi:ring-1,2-phenylacetyl-CoA epoxidase subunit PaaA
MTATMPPPKHVRRYAEASVNPFDEVEDPEYWDFVTRLIRIQADTETVFLYRSDKRDMYMELAPTPRDKVTIARWLAEEINHGYIAWRLLSELGTELGADDFGEDFEPAIDIFREPIKDWLDLAFFHGLGDRAGKYQAEEWLHSSYAPMARVAPDIVNDEQGHADMGIAHLRAMLRDDPGLLPEAQRRLERWYPITLDMFGRTDSKRQYDYIEFGLRSRTNEEARSAFMAKCEEVVGEFGLELPDPTRGRRFL